MVSFLAAKLCTHSPSIPSTNQHLTTSSSSRSEACHSVQNLLSSTSLSALYCLTGTAAKLISWTEPPLMHYCTAWCSHCAAAMPPLHAPLAAGRCWPNTDTQASQSHGHKVIFCQVRQKSLLTEWTLGPWTPTVWYRGLKLRVLGTADPELTSATAVDGGPRRPPHHGHRHTLRRQPPRRRAGAHQTRPAGGWAAAGAWSASRPPRSRARSSCLRWSPAPPPASARPSPRQARCISTVLE